MSYHRIWREELLKEPYVWRAPLAPLVLCVYYVRGFLSASLLLMSSHAFFTGSFHQNFYRPRSRGDNMFGSIRPSICLSVCLSGFVRSILCTTLWVQDYVVHHRPELCTMVHKGDLCQSDVEVTPDICMFVINVFMVYTAVLSVSVSVCPCGFVRAMSCTTNLCCAPWCVPLVHHGAQCRSVVHNIILYSQGVRWRWTPYCYFSCFYRLTQNNL